MEHSWPAIEGNGWYVLKTAGDSFAAAFVEAFLGTKNPAKILATSREAFDLDGERTIVLGSLASDTANSAGVRLSLDRATRALAPPDND